MSYLRTTLLAFDMSDKRKAPRVCEAIRILVGQAPLSHLMRLQAVGKKET